MSVEIAFPLEFIVPGTPVSLQVKRQESKNLWKERVRQASYNALPDGHFATASALAVTLFYFPSGEMTGDIDNIVKPILDALNKHIYLDDRQIERIWVQKFEPGRIVRFKDPSALLGQAFAGKRPSLYIRLGNDPTEGLV
ncbi:RusA family crossover junction endodeoxyribonuclease [Acidisphaera sp. L21]|uniref:RusA family crossover junction endodeoxyribonuclease n=1 Tax=Acidisphaera sp. L21 TaxID=1641851 RepID=UPI00131DE077|nr:RusA family crossover junction endodeoxyribonuclease [Acidisphaera sp. L21]